MMKRKNLFIFFFTLFLLFFLIACQNSMKRKNFLLFNTFCSLSSDYSKDFQKMIESLNFLEKELDTMDGESFLNQKLRQNPNEIVFEGEVASLLYQSVKLSQWLDGAFDVTVAPLVHLWKIGNGAVEPPSDQSLFEALKKVGMHKTFWTGDESRFFWKRETGFSLDFGAIAKGYAGDLLIKHYLDEKKRSYLLVNIGGNISAFGKHPKKREWRIGIQDPNETRGNYKLLVKLQDQSASTSGIYERFFEWEGIRYHHLLDPKKGYPVENELASVTVITRSALLADAASTGFFVLGQQRAIEKIKEYNEKTAVDSEKIAAVFIHKLGTVFASSSLKGKILFAQEEVNPPIEFFD